MNSGGRGGYDSDEELEDITADLEQSDESDSLDALFNTPTTSPTDSLAPHFRGKFATSNLVPTGTQSQPATPAQLCVAASTVSRSQPATPVSTHTSLGIAERVAIFENLTGARQKTSSPLFKKSLFKKKKSPLSKSAPLSKSESSSFTFALSQKLVATGRTSVKCTRGALKKGLSSPLAPQRDLSKRRKRISSKVKAAQIPIVIMAQADIPSAGRLNPRTRPNGAAGLELVARGFAVLSTDGIPVSGRNVIRNFLLQRDEIATDANLVLASDAEVAVCQVLVDEYLEQIVETRKDFEKVLEAIGADENANAEIAMNEIMKVERELRGLHRYCKVKTAGRPAHAVGVVGIRAERLKFPRFSGNENFRIFKENWKAMGNSLASDEERRMQLKQSFDGKAQSYIESQIKARTTYEELWTMLDERFDDPAAVNYNLLNNLFNSPKLSESKSTQEHWDIAVGDVQAVLDSGLSMDQILIYYRIQKFPKETVQRIKDLHRMSYPRGRNITLNEAKSVLNKLTSEDALLTQDCISMEENFQSMTLAATPKMITPAKQTQPVVYPNKNLNKSENYNQTPIQGQAPYGGGGRGARGYSGSSKNYTPNYNKNPVTKNWNAQQCYCHMCDNNDHPSHLCTKFPTPAERRTALSKASKCPECAFNIRGSGHQCASYAICKNCKGLHRTWLCPQKKLTSDNP